MTVSSDIKERDQQREATLASPAVNVRDQAREKALWDHYIQPVIDEHFPGKYQYKYFDEPTIITNRDIDSMLRTTRALCMDGYDLIFPTDYFEQEVLWPLRNGITTYTDNKEYGSVDLKELFERFLRNLFQYKTLPIYPYFLDLEHGPEGLWGPTSSDGTRGQKVNIGSVQEPQSSPEQFIKNLTIRYENDSQISIQQAGKPKKIVDLTGLGFRAGGGVTWSNFLAVLKNSPKHYWKVPDRPLNQLKTINKRLIAWLEEKYKFQFPEKYKLYRLNKASGNGVYEFTFNIEYAETNSDSKVFIKNKFNCLVEKFGKENDSAKKSEIENQIKEVAAQGLSSKALSKEEVETALSPNRQQIEWDKMEKESLKHE